MTKPRAQPNGDLVYVHRGPPPKAPPGYVAKEGDPYTLELDLVPCKHREKTAILKPCGEFRCALTCRIKENREINYLYCEDCNDAQE